ncbi:MAG: RecQ family ATP-dependent DNA helicase [Bacteroidales bacterium]|nr:RecQ family ATP-dependent DNA helicase [Bacteroidales bacterium]
MPDKLQLLKRYWRYDTFRPCQEEIIDSVLQGRDTFALLPTGGGKSLCYQLPALLMDGVCLVVSPLVALMKDQVQRLNERHLHAACLYAGLGPADTTAVLGNAMSARLKFLYVSPERLRNRKFIEHFRRMKICLIAVDEAHCVSQWGYDFRPPYLQIADIRAYHPAAPLIALTATATPPVVGDICDKLKMRQPQMFRSSFERKNLAYSVVAGGEKYSHLLRICGTDRCGIVYAGSRRRVEAVANQLNARGVKATFYHAGLSGVERDKRQAAWMQGECNVMVATNAFGMGIDKADVRFVVHIDVPDSLEAYFQEAGRAGRDGLPARAVMLCDDSDLRRLDVNLEVDFPSVKRIRAAYNALCNYYRIPLGSGAESRYDFKLNEICETYGFDVREFYGCCRFLEREGLVLLPEREESYSRLFIPVGRDELYRFQVDHMRMGDMLQAAIRMYPGLFTSSEPIEERKIAARCMADTAEVRQMLNKMSAMHIVEYIPRPQVPQVVFCSERVDASLISLGEQNYLSLKQAASERMAAIKRYVTNDRDCRSRQLLAYFGEEGAGDCLQCDVCLKRQQRDGSTEAIIMETVQQGNISLHSLHRLLEDKGLSDITPTLRALLDRGALTLDKDLILSSPS